MTNSGAPDFALPGFATMPLLSPLACGGTALVAPIRSLNVKTPHAMSEMATTTPTIPRPMVSRFFC